jgi:hypothetical protein
VKRLTATLLVLLAISSLHASAMGTTGQPEDRSCSRPNHVVRIGFSKASYPNIIRHIKKSWRLGYRKVLRINRPGADHRRDKALAGIPTKDGYDRDEAPAAVLRKRWQTDVAYVPSSENRSAGASLGNQISPYCNGVRVKYRFEP